MGTDPRNFLAEVPVPNPRIPLSTSKDAVASYIASQTAELRPILNAIRAFEREAAPTLAEGVRMDVPWYTGQDGVLYVAAYSKHVNLGLLRGAELDDPDGLLEGTGKGLRHVKVRDAAVLRDPRLLSLVKRAVSHDARKGRGPPRPGSVPHETHPLPTRGGSPRRIAPRPRGSRGTRGSSSRVRFP